MRRLARTNKNCEDDERDTIHADVCVYRSVSTPNYNNIHTTILIYIKEQAFFMYQFCDDAI